MFRKIFSRLTRRWQIVLILAGSFFGLLLLWIPLQGYFDIQKALQQETELFSEQFLVLNKKVAMLSVLDNKPDAFSEEELEAIRKVEGVEELGKFAANTFRAMAIADFGGAGQVLRTEMFFEAVPDNFLDEEPAGWNWHPKDPDVPIVIPSDYLALYNFGFAPGQHLPQISEDLAALSSFEIVISGRGNERIFKGRIAGFSDRINTILTPQKFLDYCNGEFGERELSQPSRIIVKASQAGPLEALMKEQGYETNRESMRAGKTRDFARSVFLAAIVIALAVVLISLGSFIQFTDLIIARADTEIRTLSYLGYANAEITRILARQVFVFVAFSFAGALIVGIAIRQILIGYIKSMLPDSGILPSPFAIALFFAVIFIYAGMTYLNIRRQVAALTRSY